MDSASVVTATIGILIGYFSSEVATVRNFERLLWPERFYYTTDLMSLAKATLLMPLGCVLHNATLETLDQLQENGLMTFKRNRGHMLGSPFFRDTGYKLTTNNGRQARESEWILDLRVGALLSQVSSKDE